MNTRKKAQSKKGPDEEKRNPFQAVIAVKFHADNEISVIKSGEFLQNGRLRINGDQVQVKHQGKFYGVDLLAQAGTYLIKFIEK